MYPNSTGAKWERWPDRGQIVWACYAYLATPFRIEKGPRTHHIRSCLFDPQVIPNQSAYPGKSK